MDELDLSVLYAEAAADARVFCSAVHAARQRLGNRSELETEACAYQLARAYNALEQMALRIARAFENHIDDRRGWHAQLLRRMSLDIPAVRPALFPGYAAQDLADLRGFRHAVHHAYDAALIPERVAQVVEAATRVAADLPAWVEQFCDSVRRSLSQ